MSKPLYLIAIALMLAIFVVFPEAEAQLYQDLPSVAPTDNSLEQLGIVETPPQQQSTIVAESIRVLGENTNIMNFFSSVIDACMLKT